MFDVFFEGPLSSNVIGSTIATGVLLKSAGVGNVFFVFCGDFLMGFSSAGSSVSSVTFRSFSLAVVTLEFGLDDCDWDALRDECFFCFLATLGFRSNMEY